MWRFGGWPVLTINVRANAAPETRLPIFQRHGLISFQKVMPAGMTCKTPGTAFFRSSRRSSIIPCRSKRVRLLAIAGRSLMPSLRGKSRMISRCRAAALRSATVAYFFCKSDPLHAQCDLLEAGQACVEPIECHEGVLKRAIRGSMNTARFFGICRKLAHDPVAD